MLYLNRYQSPKNSPGDKLDDRPHETMRLARIMPLKRRPSAFALSTMAHAAWTVSLGNIDQHYDILFIFATSERLLPHGDPLPKVESIIGPLTTAR